MMRSQSWLRFLEAENAKVVGDGGCDSLDGGCHYCMRASVPSSGVKVQ